jgi:hypothetical protein
VATIESNVGRSPTRSPATFRRKVDPIRRDRIAATAAEALAALRPSFKAMGAATGLTKSRLSRLCSEGTDGPVFQFFHLLDSLSIHDIDAAGSLVAYAEALHARSLMSADTHELVARFWRLVAEESQREADENSAFGRFAATGDLREFARALKLESSVQARLAGVSEELAERGVDPRTYVL